MSTLSKVVGWFTGLFDREISAPPPLPVNYTNTPAEYCPKCGSKMAIDIPRVNGYDKTTGNPNFERVHFCPKDCSHTIPLYDYSTGKPAHIYKDVELGIQSCERCQAVYSCWGSPGF